MHNARVGYGYIDEIFVPTDEVVFVRVGFPTSVTKVAVETTVDELTDMYPNAGKVLRTSDGKVFRGSHSFTSRPEIQIVEKYVGEWRLARVSGGQP